jgi:RHS repeat-associated protein
VSAVAVVVVVTNARLTGSVTVWPSGVAEPGGSTVAFTRGQQVERTVVVPFGADGDIEVGAAGVGGFGSTVDATVDVIGWFAAGGQPLGVGAPVRLADTAAGQGSCVPGPCASVAAGGSLVVSVTGPGGELPVGTGAVFAQVTATPTGSAAGVLSVADGPGAVPVAVLGADRVSNVVVVPIGADGTVRFASSVGSDVSVDVLATVAAPASTVTCASDGTGLRVSATTGAGTARMVWDRSAAAPVLVGDGMSWLLYGPQGPFEQINTTGTATPVRMLTNPAGQVTGTATWDAWGNPVAINGQTSPAGWRGTWRDTTGLVYLWHRVYDPATGQFLSVDPLTGITGQPYSYADNNPIKVDPLGLFGLSSITQAFHDMVAAPSAIAHTVNNDIVEPIRNTCIAVNNLNCTSYGDLHPHVRDALYVTPGVASVVTGVV